MRNDSLAKIEGIFLYLLEKRLDRAAFEWLQTRGALIREAESNNQLSRAFTQVPRFASRELLGAEDGAIKEVSNLLAGVDPGSWTVETLCRVWLLMQIPVEHEDGYLETVNSLFTGAELNELVALYKALPLLRFPERWISHCEEGIRSNMGPVLEAIMYHNPYPAAYLSEAAWNQMILKAFFTDKDVNRIYGLRERVNPALRATLADYVQERLAAGRTVNPDIFKLIADKVY